LGGLLISLVSGVGPALRPSGIIGLILGAVILLAGWQAIRGRSRDRVRQPGPALWPSKSPHAGEVTEPGRRQTPDPKVREGGRQMTEPMTDRRSRRARRSTPGWAAGVISFAAVMMMLGGTLQALTGLDALFESESYETTSNYLSGFDVTAWGWIHLIAGVVVAVAGFAVLSRATWARVVGIIVAVVSAIANFAFIPYYPLWSLLIIAFDVLAIWALAAYAGRRPVA
jgi:hypothetical protein